MSEDIKKKLAEFLEELKDAKDNDKVSWDKIRLFEAKNQSLRVEKGG